MSSNPKKDFLILKGSLGQKQNAWRGCGIFVTGTFKMQIRHTFIWEVLDKHDTALSKELP